MKKWLFNPFIYIAGARSLLSGAGVLLATSVISYFSYAHLDGALDMHFSPSFSPYITYLAEDVIDVLSVALTFYLAAVLFSRSRVRLVDVAGTLSMARWPLLICVVLGFFSPRVDVQGLSDIQPAHIIVAFISLPFYIWMMVLTYNAFTISCNLKGAKAVIIFIACLILAEVISKIAISELMITHLK